MSGFFQWIFSKPDVNLLIVGLDHAGKTVCVDSPSCPGHYLGIFPTDDARTSERNVHEGHSDPTVTDTAHSGNEQLRTLPACQLMQQLYTHKNIMYKNSARVI